MGSGLDILTYYKSFTKITPCTDGYCAYDMIPMVNQAIEWGTSIQTFEPPPPLPYQSFTPENPIDTYTDAKGQAGAHFEIPEEASIPYNFMVVQARLDMSYYGMDLVHAIQPSELKMKMYSWKDYNKSQELQDGAEVSSQDTAIEIDVNNKVGQYLELDLVKGYGMLIPSNLLSFGRGRFVVLPAQNNRLVFVINKKDIPNKPAEFEFVLKDPDTGQTLDTKGGKLCDECDSTINKYKYDAAYFAFVKTGQIPRSLGICPITLNWMQVVPYKLGIIKYPFVCEGWATWLFNYFKYIFCHGEYSISADGYENPCTTARVVGVNHYTPLGIDDRSDIRKKWWQLWTGNSHNWVQVGFRDNQSSAFSGWRNYDPWYDICSPFGPNPW